MKFKIDLFSIELTPISFHYGITAKIGSKNTKFIIDTGASQTVISKEFAEMQKIETTIFDSNNIAVGIGQENLSPEVANIKSLKIGELHIKNISCISLSLIHINENYKSVGQKPIDGIIGTDLLFALNSIINLKEKTILIETKTKIFDFEKYIESNIY